MVYNVTYLQLRAARQVLNLGVRDIAKLLKVSKATVNKAELCKTRDFFFKHSAALTELFKKNSITFPNEYTIRLNPDRFTSTDINDKFVLTRFQLKGSRHIVRLSQSALAQLLEVDKGVITRAESTLNQSQIKVSDELIILKIKSLFLAYNIEFHDPFSIFFKKYIDNKSNK